MATEMSRHIQELSESAWAITASAFSALLSADVLTHPASLDLRSEFRRFGRGLDGKRVALVPVIGPMFHRPSFFGMDLQSFRERFRVALADEAVSAIVLDVDSPGGQASGVQEAFAEVFRARGTKPVTAGKYHDGERRAVARIGRGQDNRVAVGARRKRRRARSHIDASGCQLTR